jgi:hypothetical protein
MYSAELDEQIRSMGLAVVKIPAMAESECAVRKADWHYPARVFGFSDSFG